MGASPSVTVMTGITLTWPGGTYTPDIVDVGMPGESCEMIDTTHQLTASTAKTNTPSSFTEITPMTVVVFDKPDTRPPVGTQGEFVATYTNSETQTFTGTLSDYKPAGVFNDKAIANMEITVSGDIVRAT